MQRNGFHGAVVGILIVAALGIGSALTLFVWLFYNPWGSERIDLESFGLTGDFFGGVLNPFLSFLALLALVITLRQTDMSLRQNQVSLEQSQNELELSRQEMQRLADAQVEQANSVKIQAFEQTFFELLKLHLTLADQTTYALQPVLHQGEEFATADSIVGRDAFKKYIDEFEVLLPAGYQYNQETPLPSETVRQLEHFFKEHQSYLGHYFRTFFILLKFIDHSAVENKKFYAGLVRAQLSIDELFIIHLNSLSSASKQLSMLERLHLFKYLD